MLSNKPIPILVTVCLVFAIWSAIRPFSYDVWAFEIAAGVIGVGLLAATYRKFRFSNLVYILVGIHFAVLAIAAKYTYAEMPLFNWLKDVLDLTRNHYDRVGHFFQGFVPVLITREVLIRVSGIRRGPMLFFICLCICLALSAFWELLEWWVVTLFYRDSGADWLGLQGDIWDPHWDMSLCLGGAFISLVILSSLHNRSMAAVEKSAEQ